MDSNDPSRRLNMDAFLEDANDVLRFYERIEAWKILLRCAGHEALRLKTSAPIVAALVLVDAKWADMQGMTDLVKSARAAIEVLDQVGADPAIAALTERSGQVEVVTEAMIATGRLIEAAARFQPHPTNSSE